MAVTTDPLKTGLSDLLNPSFTTVTVSGLTAGRVVYTGTGGLLSADAGLTWNGNTLGVASITPAGGPLAMNGSIRIVGGDRLSFDTAGIDGANFLQTVEDFNLRLYNGRGSTSYLDVALDGQRFGVASTEVARITSAGLAVTGNVGVTGGYIAGEEQTAPAAPAANGYRIFAQDNGAGKTQLMVIFATGAAQQIAIEP